MADRLSPFERSENMRRVKGKDTDPELIVRRALHAMGLRFRLHRKDMPGRPDIVLPGRRTVIFVHGCFWHRHEGCKRATMPVQRSEFWDAKFNRTIARDREQIAALTALGWRVTVLWECNVRKSAALRARLTEMFPDRAIGAEPDEP